MYKAPTPPDPTTLTDTTTPPGTTTPLSTLFLVLQLLLVLLSNLDPIITNSKIRNSIEKNEKTNRDNSLNQINITKRIEEITSTNQKQKRQNDNHS